MSELSSESILYGNLSEPESVEYDWAAPAHWVRAADGDRLCPRWWHHDQEFPEDKEFLDLLEIGSDFFSDLEGFSGTHHWLAKGKLPEAWAEQLGLDGSNKQQQAAASDYMIGVCYILDHGADGHLGTLSQLEFEQMSDGKINPKTAAWAPLPFRLDPEMTAQMAAVEVITNTRGQWYFLWIQGMDNMFVYKVNQQLLGGVLIPDKYG